MRFEGYEDELPDEDEVIEEVLGEHPRARELHLMRAALEQRRVGMLREWERAGEERARTQIQSKIAELDRQIMALRQEESITEFVENSVRGTLHKPSQEEED